MQRKPVRVVMLLLLRSGFVVLLKNVFELQLATDFFSINKQLLHQLIIIIMRSAAVALRGGGIITVAVVRAACFVQQDGSRKHLLSLYIPVSGVFQKLLKTWVILWFQDQLMCQLGIAYRLAVVVDCSLSTSLVFLTMAKLRQQLLRYARILQSQSSSTFPLFEVLDRGSVATQVDEQVFFFSW